MVEVFLGILGNLPTRTTMKRDYPVMMNKTRRIVEQSKILDNNIWNIQLPPSF